MTNKKYIFKKIYSDRTETVRVNDSKYDKLEKQLNDLTEKQFDNLLENVNVNINGKIPKRIKISMFLSELDWDDKTELKEIQLEINKIKK